MSAHAESSTAEEGLSGRLQGLLMGAKNVCCGKQFPASGATKPLSLVLGLGPPEHRDHSNKHSAFLASGPIKLQKAFLLIPMPSAREVHFVVEYAHFWMLSLCAPQRLRTSHWSLPSTSLPVPESSFHHEHHFPRTLPVPV